MRHCRALPGLAIGQDGSIFIADTGNHRVRKVSPDGAITTIAGEGHARFSGDGVLKRVAKALNITVGGVEAPVLYEGTAPGIVEGVAQINFRVPEGVKLIDGCCATLAIGTAENIPQRDRLLFYVKP